MKGMEKISEAVLDKVRIEAQQIIKEAEEKARREIEKAKNQRERRLEEEKRKTVEETKEEAARLLAQATIKGRQELLRTKTEVIDEILSRVKNVLSGISSEESSVLNLIKEATEVIGTDKVRIYLSLKDISTGQQFLKGDKELASKIAEIKEFGCSGGVIAESLDGKIRIDNTYDTRLEMLMPQILPELGRELFEG